ncbi:MAG: TonB-dependent receptor domain-containing protein [Bacillota bacterium]
MHWTRIARIGWLAGSALCAAPALSQPPAAQAEAAADYDLPAQDLSETLRAIARASGREIIFASDLVDPLRAPPVRGHLTFDQALRVALAGSDLVASYRAGAVLIERGAGRPDERATQAAERSITVTGTRIRGAGSASPVIVNTRTALEQTGVTDLAGFARILPQNFTGGQNPGVVGGGSQGGFNNVNNSTTLDLRGLGADATLTLIDGHRVGYDALDQGIDISAIPLEAVDRIEVVADGASALYGSDAVGGVANIILRRDYDGLETSARLGASTEGGNFQQQYSAVAGSRWSSGGFMLALDHSSATPIYADQRDYTRTLDPSLMLTLKSAQSSAVLAGHQELGGGLGLDVDGYVMQRDSYKQNPFLANADVHVFGLTTRPQLRSFALTPTLRAELPLGWEGSVSATRAVSRTRIDTAQWTDGSAFRSRLLYQNELSGIEATAEGPLLALPGGDARLAAGAGARNVALHVNITDSIGGEKVPFEIFTERRAVRFAYGELSLPVIGPDQHLPLVRRLVIDGALRYERWKGIDQDSTPKLGLIYEPNADATIRATWGKSFKVPTLYQVNEAVQGVLLPAFYFAPPDPPLAPGATVLLLGGGNPNLRAERATTWSASLELHPHRIEGLQLRATYFDVDFRDRITSPIDDILSALPNPLYRDLIVFNPTAAQVNAIIATLPLGLSNQTGEPFDPANVGAIIDSGLRNTAREHSRGIDFDASYRLRAGAGHSLLLNAAATYLKSDLQVRPNQPLIPRVGTIFNPPHWRGRASAVWHGASSDLSAALNYVGAVRDTRFADKAPVGPFVTVDVSAAIRTGASSGPLRNLELRASVLNLLDEKPDVIRNIQPDAPTYDSTNQSAIGRFVAVSVRKTW